MDYPEITIVIGSGRSGTSYIQRTLRESMDIGFFREPKFIIPLYRQLHKFGDLDKIENLRQVVEKIHADKHFKHLNQKDHIPSSPEEILDRVQEPTFTGILYAVFQLLAEKQDKTRLGYKFPGDVLHITALSQIFPTARFVHTIRDGRDVALSMLKFRWGPSNLYAGCRYWARRTTIGRNDGIPLGDRYFEFRMEDLLLNTKPVATTLGHFINRDRNPEQVQELVKLVNSTKRPDVAYGWKGKLNKNQRYLCEAAAGETLDACGYTLEFGGDAKISPIQVAYHMTKDFFNRVKIRLT